MAKKAKDLVSERMARFDQSPTTQTSFPGVKGAFSPIARDQAQQQVAGDIGNLDESPFDAEFFQPKLLGFDVGDDLDPTKNPIDQYNPFNPKIDFEAIRAERQSALSKIGSLGTQFVGKTLVGTVGNIIGGFYGLGSAIAQGDSDYMFDNSFYRGLDEMNEAIEAKNSVFVNQESGLGFNAKTAKELSDAFSFIAGAVAGEAIMQTAGNVAGGAGLLSLGGRAGRYMERLGKIFRAVDSVQDLERRAMQLGKTVEKLSAMRRNIDLFVKAPLATGRQILTTTGYEAGLEARMAKDEFIAAMTDEMEHKLKNSNMTPAEQEEYRREYETKMREDAEKVGMSTFLLNTALLKASNTLQFPTIFGSKYFRKRQLNAIQRKGIDDIATAPRTKAQRLLSGTARVLSNPAIEFMEETGQGLASAVSQNYYETMLGLETSSGVLNPPGSVLSDALYKAFDETYGTSEGRHEGIIGAIVGAIGLPGIKRRGEGKGYKVTMRGGVAESVRDMRKKQQYTEDAINTLNNQKLSDVVAYNKDNAVATSLDSLKEEQAVAQDNELEFADLQDNKVFRYVMERKSKGMDDFIQEDINDLQNMSLEQYAETFDKEKGFSQEQKDEEVSNFRKKAEVYGKAFDTVHRNFNLRLMREDEVSKKLTDVLTYAVANEKLYNDRLENLKQRLVQINLEDFNMDQFVKTSAKINRALEEVEKYPNAKDKEKQVAKINELIENSKSEALKTISKPTNYKITQPELDRYLAQRKQIEQSLNSSLDSAARLDRVDQQNGRNLTREMEHLTYKLSTAVDVADYLYSFKDTPYQAYGKILLGELQQGMTNMQQLNSMVAVHRLVNNSPDQDLELMAEELEDVHIQMTQKFNELKQALSKDGRAIIQSELDKTKELLSELSDFVKTTKKKEKQKEEALAEEESETPTDFLDEQLSNAGLLEDDQVKPTTKQSTNEVVNTNNNRLTFRENRESDHPIRKEFTDQLNAGTFKVGEMAELTLVERELDLNNNDYLRNKLQEAGLLDSYLKGLKKFQDDETVLDEPAADEDVFNFIRFVPINVKFENDFEQYLFEADDIRIVPDFGAEIEAFEKRIAEERNQELAKTPKDKKHWVWKRYDKMLADGIAKIKAQSNNANSNFNYRTQLLRNGSLNLTVLNVDNGDIANLSTPVQERDLNEMIPLSDIDNDTFYYSDQNGKYVRMSDRVKVKDLANHPLTNMYTEATGKMFMMYTDIAGRKIPIKVNTRMLDGYENMLFDQIEKYFKSQDRDNFVVRDSGIKFLDDRKLPLQKFLNMFMRNRQGETLDPVFIKNTFALYNDRLQFDLFTGDVSALSVKSIEELEENKDKILESLKQTRFFPNSNFFFPTDNNLDKQALKYLIDNKLINHNVDIDNNFDKIYDPNYNKGVVLALPNSVLDKQVDKKRPKSFGAAIRDLRLSYGAFSTKKKGYETNHLSMYHAIRNDILTSVRRKSTNDANKDVPVNQLIKDSINTILDKRFAKLEEVENQFPEHTGEGKILSNIRATLDYLRENALSDVKAINDLKKEFELWGAKSELIKAFRNPPAIRLPIMQYKNQDKTVFGNSAQFNTQEKADELVKMLNIMQDLIQENGYLDIEYAEDYRIPGRDKQLNKTTRWRYSDSTGVSRDQLKRKHFKSRIYGINIEKAPVIQDGQLVEGVITMSVGDLNKENGREKRQAMLLLHDNVEQPPNLNIITDLYLPFMNPSTYELQTEDITELISAVNERRAIREKAMNRETKKLPEVVIQAPEEVVPAGSGQSLLDEGVTATLDAQLEKQNLIRKQESNPVIDIGPYTSGKNKTDLIDLLEDLADEAQAGEDISEFKDYLKDLKVETPELLFSIVKSYVDSGDIPNTMESTIEKLFGREIDKNKC